MSPLRALVLLAAAALLGAPAPPPLSYDADWARESGWTEPGGSLSVMSYNIKGLPWPVAQGRDEALSAIGRRLASLRSIDAQPHIVLLQEAFGEDAGALGKAAGYRFVITGPQSSRSEGSEPLGQAFADGAQWIKGEKSGSLINGGLAILSDYPVIKIERYAFPEGACAGYDCLAAKGVLVAWINVPGIGEPIAVVVTHLNSRRATHVAGFRADEAYIWQTDAVRTYLSRVIPPNAPVIFGGDFNTGQAPARSAAVKQPLLAGRQTDGLRTVLAARRVNVASQMEAERIVTRNKDKIFSRDSDRIRIQPDRAWVPFSKFAKVPLSDHSGFVIQYTLARRPTPRNGIPNS